MASLQKIKTSGTFIFKIVSANLGYCQHNTSDKQMRPQFHDNPTVNQKCAHQILGFPYYSISQITLIHPMTICHTKQMAILNAKRRKNKNKNIHFCVLTICQVMSRTSVLLCHGSSQVRDQQLCTLAREACQNCTVGNQCVYICLSG